MKRNKIFVFGLVAAFVAILSLTLVSSTWAKYTSTVTGSDSARVAKWAFSFDGKNDADLTKTITLDLFDTVLDSDGATESDVKTGTDETIIAPGTKGTGTFSLKNTGEVNAKAIVTFTVTNEGNIPVKFTNAAGIELVANGDVYTLGEVELQMDATAAQDLTLNWEWPFDGTDATDTSLGIKGTDTIEVTVTVVFTQVD